MNMSYTREGKEEKFFWLLFIRQVLLITGTSLGNISKFKHEMSSVFDMSDLGRLSYYLGMEVNQRDGYIELKKSAYARKLVEKAGMTGCNTVNYPMEPLEKLNRDERENL